MLFVSSALSNVRGTTFEALFASFDQAVLHDRPLLQALVGPVASVETLYAWGSLRVRYVRYGFLFDCSSALHTTSVTLVGELFSLVLEPEWVPFASIALLVFLGFWSLFS